MVRLHPRIALLTLLAVVPTLALALDGEPPKRLRGKVLDAETGKPLPCRLYLRGENDVWWTVQTDTGGSAVPYRKQNSQVKDAVETHTSLSAHPFVVELPPGRYTALLAGQTNGTGVGLVEVYDVN